MTKRVPLDFSDEAYERLVFLQEAAGNITKAEVIRRSLQLYEYMINKKLEGYTEAVLGGIDHPKEPPPVVPLSLIIP